MWLLSWKDAKIADAASHFPPCKEGSIHHSYQANTSSVPCSLLDVATFINDILLDAITEDL